MYHITTVTCNDQLLLINYDILLPCHNLAGKMLNYNKMINRKIGPVGNITPEKTQ
ncbi:MAG: hypothetical protein HeimC2_08980 [Candidatus Heimdallarchaeota archaeon LC_2]|nr:MAG: hypothetical protein HeimC2_08980 [Candidatus Heimdallarchaeota archaeon LC_2]